MYFKSYNSCAKLIRYLCPRLLTIVSQGRGRSINAHATTR
nr:MAG TPA: hypothetical protein [Caudoviricetes sp.]